MSRLMDLDRGSDNETSRTFDPCTGKVDVNRRRGDETGTAKLGMAERECRYQIWRGNIVDASKK